MKLNKLILLAGLTVVFTGQASALTIVRNFGGGTASGNQAGGGDFQALFNAAADMWEAAINDAHVVTLTYSWANLGSGTLGLHTMGTQGGSPHRETSGTIQFANAASVGWFMDSTPTGNTEYTNFNETFQNLGGGSMQTGRVYTGATGNASGRTDMLSVMLHEIGHSLGLSSANTAFQAGNGDLDVDVTSPRPFAGASIQTVSGAHINLSTSLMFPSIGTNLRRLISDADLVANAEISQFTSINLNAVPEPTTMVVAGLGLAALIRRNRKAKK